VDETLSEREQWELVVGWVRQNGPWMVLGILLAAGGVYGWKAYQGHLEKLRLEAGSRFQQLISAFAKPDAPEVIKLADGLAHDFPGTGYAEQAQLLAARMQFEKGDTNAAVDRMTTVMNATSDKELKLLIRLRMARLQVDEGKPDLALSTLGAAEPGAFAPRFAEVRGDALYAKGDKEGALKAYREAKDSGSTAVDAGLLTLKINELTRS
jgi:predicted negative regulator of RcsB-dependent stress response